MEKAQKNTINSAKTSSNATAFQHITRILIAIALPVIMLLVLFLNFKSVFGNDAWTKSAYEKLEFGETERTNADRVKAFKALAGFVKSESDETALAAVTAGESGEAFFTETERAALASLRPTVKTLTTAAYCVAGFTFVALILAFIAHRGADAGRLIRFIAKAALWSALGMILIMFAGWVWSKLNPDSFFSAVKNTVPALKNFDAGCGRLASLCPNALFKDMYSRIILLAGMVIAIIAINAGLYLAASRMVNTKFSLQILARTALLIALYIVLDRIVPSVKLPGAKIGLSFVAPFIAAMLYGPVIAMLVYGIGDFIAAILFPFGTYHVGFTLVAALMGVILGLFLNKKPLEAFGSDRGWQKIKLFPNIIVPVVINCLILGLFVNTIWVAQLYGSKTYWGWFVYRLTEYAILVPAQIVLAPLLLKACEQLEKAGGARSAWSKRKNK
ncbi:MAG: folate family ECF transporter S component [Clostridia bacterium]|nr:folate family ECF transporter S component [Clostridia bacterium]